jgi:GT2 family glycosyltransferase
MIRSIAAVVPCYNRKAKTLRFVEAFVRQTYPDLALIIVDAGSRDGSIEAVRDRMPQAHVLSVSEDCYWAAATNAGVEFALAQGYDYIFTINDDSVISPDHINKLMEIATEHQAPILGSRIDYLDEPGLVWSLGMMVDWGRHLVAIRDRDRRFSDLPLEIQQAPLLPVDALAGNGILIHRSVFEAIGLYQAQYLPHYWADCEWTIRAQRAGFAVAVTPQTVLYDDYPTPTEREHLNASTITCSMSDRGKIYWLNAISSGGIARCPSNPGHFSVAVSPSSTGAFTIYAPLNNGRLTSQITGIPIVIAPKHSQAPHRFFLWCPTNGTFEPDENPA